MTASSRRSGVAAEAPGRSRGSRARRGLGGLLGLLGLLCVLAGCSSTFAVHAVVRRPAPLPARAFPVVLVSGFEGPYTALFVPLILEHLREARREVRYVPLAQLEALRMTGRIPPTAAVLVGWVAADRRAEETSEPQTTTVCGPGGCYPTTVWRPMLSLRVVARVRVTLFEGPTARPIDTRELVETSPPRSPGYEPERLVVAALAQQVPSLFDQARVSVEARVIVVDAPGARAGLGALRARRFRQAARSLAAYLATSPSLERQDLAALHYDLGIAWQFAGRYRRAAAALQRAIRLDPDEDRYRDALAQARADAEAARIRAAQDEVAPR